jgi:hypothetical protein
MASVGQVITKASVVNDFINTVMSSARMAPSGALHSGNAPRVDVRMWDNGTIISWAGAYIAANTTQLGSDQYSYPTTANLPGSGASGLTITASLIVNMCKSFANATTRLRPAQWGLYYTQYYNGQYVQTGVPSDGSNIPFFTGTVLATFGQAHLTTNYLQSVGAISNEPIANTIISAPNINNFYNNLAAAVTALRGSIGTVDLRVCHSSCHNNCHGSRGRR